MQLKSVLSILVLFVFFHQQIRAQDESGRVLDIIEKQDSVIFIDSLAGQFLEVANVIFVGNRKTKERIIIREMDIRKGKKFFYEDMLALLKTDENKIYNTGLFNSVETQVVPKRNNKVDVLVLMDERWYTWPAPIVELADRNFSEWVNVFGADLGRINYGLLLDQYNMRGLNESMSLIAQFGFTRRFAIRYNMPYINKAQTWGVNMSFGYNENVTMGYDVIDNRNINLSSRDIEDPQDRILQNTYNAELGTTYRESFYNTHRFISVFRQQQIADTIALLNPEFFLDTANQQRMLQLHYIFTRDLRDRRDYPLSGFLLTAQISKFGLGIFNDVDFTSANFHYAHYKPLNSKGLFLASSATAYVSTASGQPFNLYGALGFNNILVKGYERLILQGQHYVLQKNEIKQRVFETKLDIGSVFGFLPKQFRKVPVAGYLKGFYDHGYVYNDFPNYHPSNMNRLNTYIFGTGLGFDLALSYDLVMRFEYAYNRDGDLVFNFGFRYGL